MRTMQTPRSGSTDLPTPVLVTGAGGMLGHDLGLGFRAAVGDGNVVALDRAALDIADATGVAEALRRHRPALVVNAAAYTDVDGAERERDAAWRANALGPETLARVCAEQGVRLVHFSTDQVFDGQGDRPRSEEEPPAPRNHYGATKLEGERAVLAGKDTLCLRVQWLYGERKDRFTKLRQYDVFTPFSDQFGAPTWTREVTTVTLDLLRRRATGLFHLAYDDWASWADVYALVKAELRLPVRLEPVLTHERKLAAERPRFSVLANGKLCRQLGIDGLGSWRAPLVDFLRRMSAKR